LIQLWKSLANQWAERRLVMLVGGCRAMRRSVWNARASNGGRSLCVQISREWNYPLPIYWYHFKRNWLRYNFAADSFAADSFYIMKLCSRLIVHYCLNCMKDNKFRYLIPILRKVEPWLMARWKAPVRRLPICHNWTSFASSYRWGATRQNMWRLAAIRRG